ncbi:MAG: acetoin dehydrogenase dihydrolipoyllysine-residue acetyltransferase subunit, partial [Mesorhizobium sp.]
PEINGAFLSGLTRARSEASLLPWLKLLVADHKFLTPAFIRATLAQTQDAGLREVQADIAERFFPDGTQSIDTRDMVAGLHMPVRVIAGASDRIVPTHQAFGLPGQVGLHVFQNTGHMPQIEQAEQVLKIVLEMARATA